MKPLVSVVELLTPAALRGMPVSLISAMYEGAAAELDSYQVVLRSTSTVGLTSIFVDTICQSAGTMRTDRSVPLG